MGPSVFLSSGDGYVGELLDLHQGCQEPFRGSRRKVGYLSRCCSRKGPHFTLRGRISFFSSSCRKKVGIPLELRLEPQGPTRIASGKSSHHASCEGPLRIPLQSLPGPRSSSEVEARTSGFHSSADMDLGVPRSSPGGST